MMKKEATTTKKRILEGKVTSDKMTDTIVVKVDRYVQMSKYQKFVTISKKYKAHDAGNTKKIGDKVQIIECAPISKDKRFTLVK
jgi:small subunit ribosomal protein S17